MKTSVRRRRRNGGFTPPAGRWVSQTGSDANPGTYAQPYATIQYAWSQCAAGETIWIKDDLTPTTFSGTRPAIALLVNGTAGNPITLRGWPVGTRRTINLTNYTGDATGGTGIRVVGNYAILRDLHITQVKLPGVSAPYIDAINWRGTNGQLINCAISEIEGRGLTIGEGGFTCTNMLVQDNDIWNCYDPRSASAYGNADGIQLFGGGTGIIVERNRIWNCSDDGIDMFFQTAAVTVRDNWIWKTGYREDGTTTGGNGSGIKTGSGTNSAAHLVTRNLIFDCRQAGINANGSTIANTWSYNTIIGTGLAGQYSMALWENAVAHQILGNCSYSVSATGWIFGNAIVRTRNSFDTPPGITESAGWFKSLSRTGVDGARGADGSLPVLDFGRPAVGSALLGAGPSGNTIGAFAS
ncbi:MAG TPA: right-handed parallel beta-helix repeat-containing protein [Rhizobium sp.]|nr:right-handed parallel beta-helix repeat-containing protein [Rhizobium sp.]